MERLSDLITTRTAPTLLETERLVTQEAPVLDTSSALFL
jgi:hypothetical protein